MVLRVAIGLGMPLWLIVSSATLASTVAMVRTNAAVAIAADSERVTFRADGQNFTTLACKLYRVKQTFFAVVGPSTDFDLPNIVAGELRKNQPPISALGSAEQIISSALDSHMAFLKEKSSLLYNEVRPKKGPALSGVFMISTENEIPQVAADDFGSDAGNDFLHNKVIQRHWCPGNCRRPDYDIAVGGINEVAKQRMTEGNYPASNLVQLVSFFVQLEIDAKAYGVGGPIDTVQLQPGSSARVQAKPGCPIDLTLEPAPSR